MFIKKNGKFYSSPIPLFLNNLSVTKEKEKINPINNLQIKNTQLKIKQCLPLLLKSSDLVINKVKEKVSFNTNLTGFKIFKVPF